MTELPPPPPMPFLVSALLLVVVAVPAIWLASAYNALVRDRRRAQNAWRQIDVQLARRHDLIPNIVEAVRGAMQYERETLEALVAARRHAVAVAHAAPSVAETATAESQLATALGRLVTVVEAHPELRALRSVAALQEELQTTENRIAFARQHYNDAATRYNTRRELVPGTLLARASDADAMELWSGSEGIERVPVVDLTARR